MEENFNTKAVIFGCAGPELLPEEKSFFERCQPLGFILFSRNCKEPEQLKKLVSDLKETVHHSNPPILIDQEGGRVVRLSPPIWREVPPAFAFGQLAQENLEQALEAAFANGLLIGQELAELGITVNCAPCVDLLLPGADPIIGDRAFSQAPKLAALLSLKMLEGLQASGVIPIIKHLPGHGRAPVDSHKELPVVETGIEELYETDLYAFQLLLEAVLKSNLPQPWGMTAHVVYNALDKKETATHSPFIIEEIIRRHIGFNGFLISDCVTMKALSGSFAKRAINAIKAGCDAVLHCNGHLDEMIEVAGAVPYLSALAKQRLNASKIKASLSCSEINTRELDNKICSLFREHGILTQETFPFPRQSIGE